MTLYKKDVIMKKQGERGPDKDKRKPRTYSTTVKIEIKVPEDIADWIREGNRPSKRIINLVRRQLQLGISEEQP